jgi:hypothetical protein
MMIILIDVVLQVDAIVTFTKLSILGQEKLINYEAYTKKTPPIKLRF